MAAAAASALAIRSWRFAGTVGIHGVVCAPEWTREYQYQRQGRAALDASSYWCALPHRATVVVLAVAVAASSLANAVGLLTLVFF